MNAPKIKSGLMIEKTDDFGAADTHTHIPVHTHTL